MSRATWRLLLALSTLPGGAETCVTPAEVAAQSPGSGYVVAMTAALAEYLNTIADSATVEHGACLYGKTTPDTVRLSGLLSPPVFKATPLTLDDGTCPGFPLAYWHVHIPHKYTVMGDRAGGPDKAPEEYCALSQADRRFAVGPDGPPMEWIGVGHRIFCWWSRSEIMEGSPNAAGNLAPARWFRLPELVKPVAATP